MPGGSAPRVLALTGDIALVVADVPAAIYRTDTIEARLTDLEWVALCGAAHHAVADALAPKHNVVPFRLVHAVLERGQGARDARPGHQADRRGARSREGQGGVGVADREGSAFRRAFWNGCRSRCQGRPEGAAGLRPAPSGTAFLAGKAAAKKAAAETAMRVRRDAAAVFDALEEIADQANQRSIEAASGLLLDAAFLVPARSVRRPSRRRSRKRRPVCCATGAA